MGMVIIVLFLMREDLALLLMISVVVVERVKAERLWVMERKQTWEAGIRFSTLLLPAGCSVRGGGGKQVACWRKQGHCRRKVGKDVPCVLGITYMFLPTVRRLQLWQMH
jgi:hypothetical protein